MNVVIDARLILPRTTGIGTYLCGLARGLRQIEGEHHFEYWLQPALPADHAIHGLAGGSLVLRQVPLAHMNLRQQWQIPALLRRRRPDVYHYPHFDLPWLAPVPTVATIHDLKYIAWPQFFPRFSRLKRLLMFAAMALTVRRAERVIAVSESTRQDILRRLRADPERVVVVPEAVEARYFEPPAPAQRAQVRRRYELEAPFILFLGERRPHKNIVGVLRAFQALRQLGYRQHQLLIGGKAYADYDEPERLAEQILPAGTVRFLGYVPDEDLPALYHAADAFVLLSLYEGFGLPVLEAMAAGTPVVAARATSLPEVVGEGGLLVDPDDPQEAARAFSRVLSGGTEREHWQRQARQWARRFSWKACAERTVEVYREAMGE
ncbi:MAG: glycosyltransferase family 4 protein [Chloroflexia bacterium]|nr:glycosyltransferase family 4 protein [Chloroflexia bacterium]